MKKKFFSKFGKIKRRAFLGMLGFVLVFQACAANAFAGITQTYQGYKWVRIHNEAELRAYQEQAENDRAAKGRKLVDGTKDKTLGNGDQWFKAIIAYKTNGVTYFMSGSSMCDDGEKFSASRVLPSYDMPIGADEFITRSGYFAPYIKYAGDDSDNGNAPKFYVRFSKTDSEEPSDQVLIGNASWYGIEYAAAMYGQLHKTSMSNPSAVEHTKPACSATVESCFTMQWQSNGLFRAYYNIHGVADRWWEYNDKNYKLGIAKSPSKEKSEFYLYIGVPHETQKIDKEVTVLPGYTTTYDSTTVTQTGSIVIPKNATVVIQGKSYNNGEIHVDGGTLIIKGTLDTDLSLATPGPGIMPGSVRVKNGGCVYVEETGLMICRFGYSYFTLENGSTCTIAGSVVHAGHMTIDASSVMVREGAALIQGVAPKEEVDSSSFGRAFIKKNKNNSLSNYVMWNAPLSYYYLNKELYHFGVVEIKNGGFLDNAGLYCIDAHSFSVSDDSYTTGQKSTNPYATIDSMMWCW